MVPEVHIDTEALPVLQALVAQHPSKRIRIRHDGYG